MADPALLLPRNAMLHRKELEQGRVSHGYVAFADFKGFTSLTESLKVLGKEGAEAIATQIDELMMPIANAALRFGGNIIAVEGDALLVSFDSKKNLLSFCVATRELSRRTISTKIGDFDVALDLGVGSGNLYEMVVGNDSRRAYVVAGEALEKAYAMEKLSEGDVVADAPYSEAKKVKRGNLAGFILKLEEFETRDEEALTRRIDPYSQSFIPPGVREGSFNEFLPVTSVFCDLDIIADLFDTGSLSKASEAMNELFMETHRIVEISGGGTIDKFKRFNSLFLFGAPLVHEDDSRRAVETIGELGEAAERIAGKFGIESTFRSGINRGIVFSGEICGRYTVMGDAVNTAARIKEISGGIYCSGSVRHDVRDGRWEGRGEQSFRGKSERSRVFAFLGFIEPGREEFVLRERELEYLRGRLLSAEKGLFINVVGDIGSGKDRLLTSLSESLEMSIEVRPSALSKTDPYRTVMEIAKKALGVSSDAELLAGRKIGDASLHLDFENAVLRKGVIVISSGDNIDSQSLEFLASLTEKASRVGTSFVISSSERIAGAEELRLDSLGREEAAAFARHLARKLHGADGFAGDTLEDIFKKSKGNPLFIAELVKAAKNSGRMLYFEEEIPEKLEQLLLAKMTKLPYRTRLALKVMSLVYGADERIVERIQMGDEIDDLVRAGILMRDYEFSSELVRKVAQGQIPAGEKTGYYTRIALVLEDLLQGDLLRLSHYFSNADANDPDIRAKAVSYIDRYLKSLGDLSVARPDRLERIIAIADRNDPSEKRICVDAILGTCKIRHVNATRKEDYQEYLELAREAESLSTGEDYGYRALLEVGRALCWLGDYEKGFETLERSRSMALDKGDIPYFGNISAIYGYALSYRAGNPEAGIRLLENTVERLVESLEGREISREFGYALSTTYFALAECSNRCGMYPRALGCLDRARYYSEVFSIPHIFVQSLGTMGEVLFNMGQYKKAERHCLLAERVMEQNNVQIRHFRKELYELLSKIYWRMRDFEKSGKFGEIAEGL
jgi:class 3 adenylate cyclase/tetratricopeptide (TPR) repeat protein